MKVRDFQRRRNTERERVRERGREREGAKYRFLLFFLNRQFVSALVILCGMSGRKITLLLYLWMKGERRKWWVFRATGLS